MNDQEHGFDRHEQVLMGLAMNLQATAMVQLGKMAHPGTGKMDRDLEGARISIDVIEALKVKCKGNLAPDVVSLFERMLMDLQLNFADEAAAGSTSDDAAPEDEPKADSADGDDA